MKKFIITNDVFNIAKRLRQIDRKYFLIFNTVNKKFEVHYKGRSGSPELTLPFNTLDNRTIIHVLKTKIENSARLFKEMEEQNILLQKRAENNLLSEMKIKTEEILRDIEREDRL